MDSRKQQLERDYVRRWRKLLKLAGSDLNESVVRNEESKQKAATTTSREIGLGHIGPRRFEGKGGNK